MKTASDQDVLFAALSHSLFAWVEADAFIKEAEDAVAEALIKRSSQDFWPDELIRERNAKRKIGAELFQHFIEALIQVPSRYSYTCISGPVDVETEPAQVAPSTLVSTFSK